MFEDSERLMASHHVQCPWCHEWIELVLTATRVMFCGRLRGVLPALDHSRDSGTRRDKTAECREGIAMGSKSNVWSVISGSWSWRNP